MQGNLPNSPISDAVLSPGVPASPGDELESLSLAEQRLFHLQRQLDIETKVNMLFEMVDDEEGTADNIVVMQHTFALVLFSLFLAFQ